jgi:anti-sigma regulatory factor (Ser/Thr protein kinase)/serine/threonine protein phosphatase PrpC
LRFIPDPEKSQSLGGNDLRFASIALPIVEVNQIGEARRRAVALADRLHFNETEIGEVAIIVTEAAGNIVKHAQEGVLLLQPLCGAGVDGLEIMALDKGPGIKDVERCLRDGFSTAGSPGTGLGAIARLASCFDLHSIPPTGTALLAQLWPRSSAAKRREATCLEVGAVHVAKTGEAISGDAWALEASAGSGGLLLVADGLGHGPEAAAAAREAVRIFRASPRLELASLLQTVHGALRSTRGAAVAVAALDLDSQTVRFAGVGNISGTILANGDSRSMVSHNGTAGCTVYKIQEFVYPFPPGALLVLASDGLLTRWQLDSYLGLTARHPSLVAGVLFRDFNRGRDDTTIVVVRAAAERRAL